MHDKELNVKTRNLYDFAMLLDAQQKSGYNIFEVTDKPLPLKWEALTPLQQRAVDHAIEKELDAPVAGMDLNELDKQRITRLENPANLQPMIDAYRNAPKRSRAGQPSAGIGNYRS